MHKKPNKKLRNQKIKLKASRSKKSTQKSFSLDKTGQEITKQPKKYKKLKDKGAHEPFRSSGDMLHEDSMPYEGNTSRGDNISRENSTNRRSRDRYDPWRVEKSIIGGQTSKFESFFLVTLLIIMFLGSYGVGWFLGGFLRQELNQAGISSQTQPIDQDSDTDVPKERTADDPEKLEELDGQDTDQAARNGQEDNLGPIESGEEGNSDISSGAIPTPDITGKKLIALTFDDGPSGAITDQLLMHLRQKQVRATFFVLGYMAERSPHQLQKEISEGHEVGSHTANHTAFSRMSAADLINDSVRMNQIFTNILGHNTPFMRPPYGDGAYTEKARKNIGQPMILWTVDTLDWKYRDAPTVRNNAVKDAFDGAIILFHDVYQSTVDAIPAIIDDLRAQGYEFLTVSELAKVRGVTMQNGLVYGSFTP